MIHAKHFNKLFLFFHSVTNSEKASKGSTSTHQIQVSAMQILQNETNDTNDTNDTKMIQNSSKCLEMVQRTENDDANRRKEPLIDVWGRT